MINPLQARIVAHPQGGFTLAVPVRDGSTAKIYRGWWARRPSQKILNSRRRLGGEERAA